MPDLSYSGIPSGLLEMLANERSRIEQASQEAFKNKIQQLQGIAKISQESVQPQQTAIEVDPEMMKFGEYKYKAELAPRLQEYTNRYNQLNGILQIDPKQESFVKHSIDLLNKQFPNIEPFEKTEQYKSAVEAAKSQEVTKESSFIDLLGKTIKTVESNPKEFQANAAKTFLTSLINSAKGTADAEQAGEFIRRAPELESYMQYAKDTNSNAISLSTIGSYLNSNPGKKFSNLLSSDPENYIKKVKDIYNDKASTWNNNVYNRIVKPTSPDTAEMLGVVPKQSFDDILSKDITVNRQPNISITTPPPGAVRRIK